MNKEVDPLRESRQARRRHALGARELAVQSAELYKKNTSHMQDMCFEKGHNWNDLSVSKKRGTFIRKGVIEETGRTFWDSSDVPDFSKDRSLILDLLVKEEG